MKVNKDFILRELYGKAILMPIRKNEASNDPIFLNPVGAAIWNTIENNMSKTDLIDNIAKKYKLRQNSAEITAVATFVDQLLEMKLISE